MNDMSTTGGAHERSGAKSSMSHGEVRKSGCGSRQADHPAWAPRESRHGTDDHGVLGQSPAMLSQVKVGDSIDFVAEERDGALTMT